LGRIDDFMSRVGEPVVVATPPPLPPGLVGGEGSTGGARGPKIANKVQSRSRAREGSGGKGRENVAVGEGERASVERASDTLYREGSFDSEADEQQSNNRHANKTVGEHPQTPVNGTSAGPVAGSGGAPKAVRRLRDTTANTTGCSCHPHPMAVALRRAHLSFAAWIAPHFSAITHCLYCCFHLCLQQGLTRRTSARKKLLQPQMMCPALHLRKVHQETEAIVREASADQPPQVRKFRLMIHLPL